MMESRMSFRDWFRGVLAERDLSLGEAARLLGISATTVRGWWQGQGLPSYTHLVKLVTTFGVLPPDLDLPVRSTRQRRL